MKKNLLSGLVKSSGNPYAGNIKTCEIYKTKYYIDTGNYILNACVSGDMFKGIPSGMIVQWTGEKSTGKSFITSNMMLHHIKSGKNNLSILFETEGALISDQILPHLSDDEQERFLIFPITTIEDAKRQINSLIEYLKSKKDEFKDVKILATFDSIGMPASEKEKEDSIKDKIPRDMTRAQAIKSLFRTIVMDFAILKIPMNVVNHQYATMDQWNPKEESGGSGMAYSNSITLELRKKKLKNDKKEQIGTAFTIIPKKSRIMAENISKIEIYSKFKVGMDRFSGCFEFLKNHNLSNQDRANAAGGAYYRIPEMGFEIELKELAKLTPEQFWTQDKLEYINEKFKDIYLLERSKLESNLADDVNNEVCVKKEKGKTK